MDVENYIITKVREAVLAEYPDADIISETLDVPPRFPCVSVVMTNAKEAKDSTDEHEMMNLYFTINIYTNHPVTKKADCKKLYSIVNRTLRVGCNFTRASAFPAPIIHLTGNAGSAKASAINSVTYRMCANYVVGFDGATFYKRR